MPSYKFDVYRYTYSPDNNLGELIREQRVQVDVATNTAFMPVTNKFLERAVSLPADQQKIKAEKINGTERRGLVTFQKGDILSTTNRYIPFNNEAEIIQQLEQVKVLPNVICIEYFGESRK